MPVKQDIKTGRTHDPVTAVIKTAQVWGGKFRNILDAYGLSSRDKITIIRSGISKKQLTDIKGEIEVDYDELSEILGTSRATLIGKKKTQKFDSQISERILLLADVI